MNKDDFVLGDYHYESVVNGVLVKIQQDAMSDETIAYANKIINLYLSKKSDVIEYILNKKLLSFYGGRYSKDEIVKRLNQAEIEIISKKWGVLLWLNHRLDEHLIEVEFHNNLELSRVNIDG